MDVLKKSLFFGFVFLSVLFVSCVPDDAVTGEAFVKSLAPVSVVSCSNAGDESASPYVAGIVSANVKVGNSINKKAYSDKCVNGGLIEYVCDNNKKAVKSSLYSCEVGCSTSPAGDRCNSISEVKKCVDPDNTYSPSVMKNSVKNIVSYSTKTITSGYHPSSGVYGEMSDQCLSETSILEVYCLNETAYSWGGDSCPVGTLCSEGACVVSEVKKCVDPDNTFSPYLLKNSTKNIGSYFAKTITSGYHPSLGTYSEMSDQCVNKTWLIESYCLDETVYSWGGDSCPVGTLCSEGACAFLPENCSNGVDDDLNGLTDCAESSCQKTSICNPPTIINPKLEPACQKTLSCNPATVTDLKITPFGDGKTAVVTAQSSSPGYVEFSVSCPTTGAWKNGEGFPFLIFANVTSPPYTAKYPSGSICSIDLTGYRVEYFKANSLKSDKQPCQSTAQSGCDGSVKTYLDYFPCTGFITLSQTGEKYDCASIKSFDDKAKMCGMITSKQASCQDDCIIGDTKSTCSKSGNQVFSKKKVCTLIGGKIKEWQSPEGILEQLGCPSGTTCVGKEKIICNDTSASSSSSNPFETTCAIQSKEITEGICKTIAP